MRWREWSDTNRTLLVSVIVMTVLDLVYPLTYALNLHAYDAAPSNSSLAPEDDPGFFGTGFLSGGITLLRDVAIIGATVGVVLQVRRLRSRAVNLQVLVVGLIAFALEVLRFAADSDYPSRGALLVIVAVCGLNILALWAIMRASHASGTASREPWPATIPGTPVA